MYDKFTFRVKPAISIILRMWAVQEGGLVKGRGNDFLQRVVGDLVFLKLPETGSKIARDGYAGPWKTSKHFRSLFVVSGRIAEVNSGLIDILSR